MNEQERQELEANIAHLRAYRDTLSDGPDRDTIDSTIEDGESMLRAYADEATVQAYADQAPTTTPDATSDATPAGADAETPDDTDTADTDVDGLSDEEFEELIAELQEEAQEAETQPEKGKRKAAPGPREYASAEALAAQRTAEQHDAGRVSRLSRLERERLDARVDTLVSGGRVLPGEAEDVRALMYTLAGVQDGAGVRVYSSDGEGRDQAVDALVNLLDARGDLGLTRTYTAAGQSGAGEGVSVSLTVPANASINDESAELTRNIMAYMKREGIKDFATAMLQYDQAHKGTVKSYASSIR